jgi:hypothetical protein
MLSKTMMNMEQIGGIIGSGNQSTERKPSPCLFVHHKSHMALPESPLWETGD